MCTLFCSQGALSKLEGGGRSLKTGSGSAPQKLKTLIVATILIVAISNTIVLLPVSPAYARSEQQDQTCEACRLINGNLLDVSASGELLWYYSRVDDDGVIRTMALVHLTYSTQASVRAVYVLGYSSQHDNHRISIVSSLSLGDPSAYGIGFTHFDFMPFDEQEAVILTRMIELDTSLTLSDGYIAMARSMKQIAVDSMKSGDEALRKEAGIYHSISQESIILANLVRENLYIYDKPVLQNVALVTDLAPGTIEFWICTIIVQLICGYFVGMACDYVAGVVASSICSLLCGGPWNFWCMIACVPGMIGFVYLICNTIAGYGCAVGADYICLHI